MEIRNFTLADFCKVIEMSRRSYEWEDEEDRDIAEELLRLHKSILEYYSSEPEGLFVAEENGRILGTCFGKTNPKNPRLGSIGWVGVDPASQGKGTGGKLLEKTLSYLNSKGVKTVRLGTDRPRAMPFYLKRNFKIVGWSLVFDLNEEEVMKEGKAEKLLRILGDYGNFKFTPLNSARIKEQIGGIIKAGTSEEAMAEKLLMMARDYWGFMSAPGDLQTIKNKIRAILEEKEQ